MWVSKVLLKSDKHLIGRNTIKHNVSCTGYPLQSFIYKNNIHVHIIGFVFGEEKNIKKFLRDLKKNKRTVYIERQKDFHIGQIKESISLKNMYNPKIVHINPIIINEKGEEYWTVGCFQKKVLSNFLRIIKRKYNGKILFLKRKKIKNISLISFHPNLTDKQKKALELAIRNGYYEYPRKIKLEKLAKAMKISFSTFQAHLRKAERKIMPFMFEKL